MKRYRVTVLDRHWAHVYVEARSKAEARALVQQMDDEDKLQLVFHTGDRLVQGDVEIAPETRAAGGRVLWEGEHKD